ncbi:MAG TPA: threonine/serine exporter family protein [Paraburkholderia sp.]|uniref:threonine/serine exporter family protein n=1 Tax=Paraburkholderia sp. TaxID=1926495 RepID=UPI002BC1D11D|nr:threonine/serine exporter family protein [Paraburkholderia sp.]HTR07048.1 threonine/serine exporter family protein [Paraburkholderia sp.]
MTLQERSDLVLAFARVLFVNGQATEQTLRAAESVGKTLGLRSEIVPRWGELQLQAENAEGRFTTRVAAEPAGVNMHRVASTMRSIGELNSGRCVPEAAPRILHAISQSAPAAELLFVLAAGAGAVALAVLYGVQHLSSAAIIFASAAAGALLRRTLARYGENLFVQPFCASLVAGAIGALAVRYELSSSLRLIALCPCMILVPGPHVLNGAMDLFNGRIHLGASRLIYAGLVIVAISIGLLLGLALFGVTLPVHQIGKEVSLWQDVLAAGVAVAAFSIFFSMPANMLAWPVAVGMLAHALRWGTMILLGASAAAGAFVACLVAGLVLAPVSHRVHMPFAAIGFAAVVSMMPGLFLFRTASGLIQLSGGAHTTLELIGGTIADGMTAITIILAMSLGLIGPKLIFDRISRRATQPQTQRSHGDQGVAE